MRLSTLGERAAKKVQDEKPYLPIMHNDERKMIMEQYFKSKKKLNK